MSYLHGIEDITSQKELKSKISDLEVAKQAALLMQPAAQKYALKKISEDTKKLEKRKEYLERERARELQNFAEAKSHHMAHHLGVPVPKPSHAKARAAKDSKKFSREILEEALSASNDATLDDEKGYYMKAIPSYFKAASILENFDPI